MHDGQSALNLSCLCAYVVSKIPCHIILSLVHKPVLLGSTQSTSNHLFPFLGPLLRPSECSLGVVIDVFPLTTSPCSLVDISHTHPFRHMLALSSFLFLSFSILHTYPISPYSIYYFSIRIPLCTRTHKDILEFQSRFSVHCPER